jgi:enediyne biosynthesis protein E4
MPVTTNNGPAHVLLNQTSNSNHWIAFNLIGTKSNRDAIGAQVRISTSNGNQFASVSTASSYQSSGDKRVHFGLGTADSVREVAIRWPSGVRQLVTNQKADNIVTITEPVR